MAMMLDKLYANLQDLGEPAIPYLQALARLPSGTIGVKRWFQQNDGATVLTLQWRDDTPIWAPTPRTIQSRPTFALLDDSRLYYRGLTTVSGDDNTIAVYNKEFNHYTVYFPCERQA